MGIDPKTLRPGEVVHVRGAVAASRDEMQPFLIIDGDYFYLDATSIVSVEPRPIEVGDTVEFPLGGGRYVVRAIYSTLAWVEIIGTRLVDRHHIIPLADLRLAPHDTSTGEG